MQTAAVVEWRVANVSAGCSISTIEKKLLKRSVAVDRVLGQNGAGFELSGRALCRSFLRRGTQRTRRDGLLKITSAIPPRIATEASSMRNVRLSPRKTTPPSAAMTGTLNCTVAA